MARILTLGILFGILVLSGAAALLMGGTSTFDMLGFTLTVFRMTYWMLGVALYYPLLAALGENDLEEDWNRINAGNVAVALYRGLEFLVVGVTLAVLISQI